MPAFSDVEQFLNSFSEEEIRVTRHAFRRLLAGQATELESLPAATGLSPESVERALDALLRRGTITIAGGRRTITGARGLSLAETKHRLQLGGHQLYTFCAVDAVGIPAALEVDAVVQSRCHQCGALLELMLTKGRVARAPQGVMIWAGERDPSRSLHEHT